MTTTSAFDLPFHEGEVEVQTRLGVHERSAAMGRKMIRPYLLDQHRDFYADLSFLIIGAADADGRVWASALGGAPGFLSTPDDRTLTVGAKPVEGDPIISALQTGADIGVVGMLPDQRRRNRMTGRIGKVREDGFDIEVLQSFGNCPQYIQARDIGPVTSAVAAPKVNVMKQFDQAAIDQITAADALFIASAYRKDGAATQGADASHRGGKPGFVKVVDQTRLLIPDFRGNNAFNTIGNIVKNPNTGFLFIDFEKGDVLTMTGAAHIIWDGPEVDGFEGAQRLIAFDASEIHRIAGGFSHRSTFIDYAPQLARTGAWAA